MSAKMAANGIRTHARTNQWPPIDVHWNWCTIQNIHWDDLLDCRL